METKHLQQPRTRLRFWLRLCVGIMLGMVMLAGITRAVIRARQPDLPKEWWQLRPGMSRTQVEATIPDALHYLRDMKGFDSSEREIGRDYVWTLNLYYTANGQTTGAEVHLLHLRHGILGRNSEKLF